MLCLAAQRKSFGNLVVVSPDEGYEFDINEDLLNIHMIELGNFCQIDVEDNLPKSYTFVEEGIEGVTVKVEKNLARVHGVTGKLTKGIALFYQTEQFGKVACRDEEPGEVGAKCKIVISRLPEDKRVGMYSKCVWGAVAEEVMPAEKEEDVVTSTQKKLTLDPTSNGCCNFNKFDVSENEIVETIRTEAKQEITKKVTGVITRLIPDTIKAIVACSLSYPGADGTIEQSASCPLKIGDWVEIRFSTMQYDLYFPEAPTLKTPRFSTKMYKKIPNPERYSLKIKNRVPEMTIKSFETTAEHKQGDNLHDRFLGIISDKNKLLADGQATVDLVIVRQRVFMAKGKKPTTWILKTVKKVAMSSEESSETESTCSGESERTEKSSSVKMNPKKSEKPINQHRQPVSSQPPRQMTASAMSYLYPGMATPLISPQGYFFPAAPMMKKSDDLRGKYGNSIRGIGFKEGHVDETEFINKRAVVTSVKPGVNGSTAFLWLLDDHKQSVFYTNQFQRLQPGHFFDGSFARNGDKWECKKYNNSLGKLLEGCTWNDTVELQISVEEYYPVSADRMAPETYHKFLGKIVDKYNKLPEDCSAGVKVCVRLFRLEMKNKWCWVITKIHQPKHTRLLVEFYRAWHVPEVRDKVLYLFPKEFKSLKTVFDIQPLTRLEMLRINTLGQNAPKTDIETVKKVDEQSKKNYAWVTVKDGDFIRMILFPRQKGQTMNKLKSNVSEQEIYKEVSSISANRLYEVTIDKNGKVTEMFDCPQFFSANEKGDIEFKFISTEENHIARNVAIVEPVEMPKWLGKLMFQLPERPIPKRTMLWKGVFHLLDERNPFMDDDEVIENGVCFVNSGAVEKLPYKELNLIQNVSTEPAEEPDDDEDKKLFKTKLKNLPKPTVFSLFADLCRVLRSEQVVEELKKRAVYTESLQSFINNSR